MKRSDCKLRNGLGSLAQVEKSEIGVNGVNVGATFVTAILGNAGRGGAARFDANAEEITFSNAGATSGIDYSSMAISFFLSTDYSVTNGYPSDGVLHALFDFSFDEGGVFKFIALFIHTNANRIYLNNTVGILCKNTTIDWNAIQWYHWIVIVDRLAGFDGGKTSALYHEGVQIASGVGGIQNYSTPEAPDTIHFGNASFPAPIDGVMSDFHIFANPTAEKIQWIYANRHLPSFGGARRRTA